MEPYSAGKDELVADSRREDVQQENDVNALQVGITGAAIEQSSTTACPYFARYGYRDISGKRD